MRIAIVGIAHEALTFVPILATRADFDLWRGQEVLDFPGVAQAVHDLAFEPVPLLIAQSHTPGGPVDHATYVALRDEILAALAGAGRVDAVCLVLHGSMLVQHLGSGDTDLVRMVRAAVGPHVLLGARLDLHANLTDAFASDVDVWAGYRTAPHRDIPETFHRAAARLVHAFNSRHRPRPVFVRLPLLLPGEQATTDVDPMRSLLSRAADLEGVPGMLAAEVLVGFGWADSPHAGASVTVFAESAAHLAAARDHACQLAAAMWSQRADFQIPLEVADSVDIAIDRALAADGTVFVTDTGDNLTAGATGDVPYFLSRLVAREVPDAVVAGICDAEAYAACVDAGVGAPVTVSLGGKIDTAHGAPVTVTGTVEQLYAGDPAERAVPIATFRVGGIWILIPAQRRAFYTLADFRRAGIDPLQHRLVIVKLGYLFPELRDIAPREILARSPGWSDLDLHRLPFEHVTRPIYPLDQDFQWRPAPYP
jgi:microcystin degradation protein MlrC